MAKGLAVISGSNTVVFKALENGVIKMGGVDSNLVLKPAQVTISGSLTLSGSEGVHLHVSGSEFKLENLSGLGDQIVISGLDDSSSDFGQQPSVGTQVERHSAYELKKGMLWAATSSVPQGALEDKVTDPDAYYAALAAENSAQAPEDFLVITESGELRRVNKIDASVVMLNDGQTVEQQVGGLNLNLRRTSDHGEVADDKDVNLTKGRLEFKDVDARTKISMEDSENGESVKITIDLDQNLEVETLSASMGLEVTGSSNLRGKLHVVDAAAEVDGALDVHGAATVDGDMTIKGNLNVWGDTTVTTADSQHLQIEDAILHIGKSLKSGSEDSAIGGVDGDSSVADLGFVFGDQNKRALVLKEGDFYLGKTEDNANSTQITVDYESANNITVFVPNLSASADIQSYTLSVLNNADVGGTLDVTGAATFSNTVSITGKLTVSNSGSFTGDLNVDGIGSFGQSVTLRTGANLTLDQGSATLTQGDLTLVKGNIDVQDGNLDVNGVTTLSASLGGDQLALDVTGTTKLSSSAGSNALHVDSGNVKIDEALTVDGAVSLNGSQGALNIAGTWTEDAAVKIAGSLDVAGNVKLGTDSGDKVIVQGQFRIPKFNRLDTQLDDFVQYAADYEGYMFYLDDVHDFDDPHFPRGKKWYFNEGGVWHSSFFWDDGAEANATPE